jgi:hypothetical protein
LSDLGFCACRVLPGLVHIAGRTCTSEGEPTVLLPYWRLHLPAFNLSPRMICAYTGYRAPHPSGRARRSRQHQYPAQACRGVYRRETGRIAPSSAATRYRSLQRLFRWLDDEGEIDGSPMAKMYPRSSRRTNPSTCTYTVARPPWATAGSVGPCSHGGSTLDERWAVTSGLNPMRFSRYEVPRGLYRIRNSQPGIYACVSPDGAAGGRQ